MTQEITSEMIEQRNRLLVLVSRLTGVPADDIMGRMLRAMELLGIEVFNPYKY